LHACLISDCRNPAVADRQNLGGAEIRQHPATGILTEPEFGDIRPPSLDAGAPDSGRNWLESSHGQKPVGSSQNGRNPVRSSQNGQDPTGSGGVRPESGNSDRQLHFRLS
jgi:hypothetical protein